MAPLLPDLLPGDYLLDSFGSSLICQLCAVGMKLAPLQRRLLQRFEVYGGAAMHDDPIAVVAWLLDTYVNGYVPSPAVVQAMSAHGDALATGPTSFLRQLGIITIHAPFPSASPLVTWTDRLYYQELDPALVLRRLRAAFEHVDVQIQSAVEYIRVQDSIIDILVENMHDISRNYTGPYLATKNGVFFGYGAGLRLRRRHRAGHRLHQCRPEGGPRRLPQPHARCWMFTRISPKCC